MWHGPLRVWRPDPGTLDIEGVLLAAIAAILLLRMKLGMAPTLVISASVALAWFILSGGAVSAGPTD